MVREKREGKIESVMENDKEMEILRKTMKEADGRRRAERRKEKWSRLVREGEGERKQERGEGGWRV